MRVATVLVWEGSANVLLAAAKFIVGLQTGSSVILGDALHSLTDLANNGIALFVNKVASEPPDRDHPYGHQKFEQLAVFVLASLLTVVAVELVINAFKHAKSPPVRSEIGLIVMLFALAINVGVTIWERYWAKKLKSDLLLADAYHTLGDVFVTFAAIVGWQVAAAKGWGWLDSVFAVGVAGLVLYLAFDLFRRAIPSLVDSAGRDPRQVIAAVDRLPEVKGVKRLRSRQHGNEVAADIIVTVDRNLTLEQSHEVADAIEALLAEQFDIHDTTVHIEPAPDENARRR